MPETTSGLDDVLSQFSALQDFHLQQTTSRKPEPTGQDCHWNRAVAGSSSASPSIGSRVGRFALPLKSAKQQLPGDLTLTTGEWWLSKKYQSAIKNWSQADYSACRSCSGAALPFLCCCRIVFFTAEFQEPDQALPWGNKPARLWS